MKKPQTQEPPTDDAAAPSPEDVDDSDTRQGRSGEGAHSAMKHWLHEERHRIKRPEH